METKNRRVVAEGWWRLWGNGEWLLMDTGLLFEIKYPRIGISMVVQLCKYNKNLLNCTLKWVEYMALNYISKMLLKEKV